MITITVLLLLCAIFALLAHVLKPTVPLWIALLFVIVAFLVSALPIK